MGPTGKILFLFFFLGCDTACETGGGLDELEIDELNKKFDEFIQSRRSKWIKEEEAYLQWHQA